VQQLPYACAEVNTLDESGPGQGSCHLRQGTRSDICDLCTPPELRAPQALSAAGPRSAGAIGAPSVISLLLTSLLNCSHGPPLNRVNTFQRQHCYQAAV
jgi:hypothetical protein